MSITAHTPAALPFVGSTRTTMTVATVIDFAAHLDANRVATEAEWANFSPAAAREWMEAGFSASEAIEWQDAGWSADEAAALRDAEFTTYDAEPWLGSDSNIDNILRCLRAGIDPYDSDPYDSMGRRGGRMGDDDWN